MSTIPWKETSSSEMEDGFSTCALEVDRNVVEIENLRVGCTSAIEFEPKPLNYEEETPPTTRHSQHERLELVGEVYHQASGGGSIVWPDPSSATQFKSPMHNNVLHVAALCGDNNNIIHEMLDKVTKRELVNLLGAFNKMGETPLHVGARKGNITTLRKMLEYLTDSADLLWSRLTCKTSREGNTVLHEAVMSTGGGDSNKMVSMIFHVIEAYFSDKTIPSETTTSSQLDLHYKSRVAVLALDEVNNEHQSVLYLAVQAGLKEIVNQILDNCNESATPKGISPLIPAIMNRDLDMLTTLVLKRNEWIHLRDERKRLAMHCAASIGFYKGVVYLLGICKSCSIQRDSFGYTPLHLAADQGHIEVVNKLLKYCPNPTDEMLDSSGRNILHIAANNGKLDMVRYILQNPELGKMINQKSFLGETPLHEAAASSHPKVVYALTWDHRVDLNTVNRNKQTALDVAVEISTSNLQNPSLTQSLTWIALKSAGAERNPSKAGSQYSSTNKLQGVSTTGTERYKDRVDSLNVISTLIVTASVAACLAVPGEADGTANNLHKAMFQFFIFCITVSLFSSIIATIILIWGRLGLIQLLNLSIALARPLLGVALISLSLAFLAGVYTVISKLTWLATIFLVTTSISVLVLFVLYVLIFLPMESTNKVSRYLSYYPFIFLAWLAGRKQY